MQYNHFDYGEMLARKLKPISHTNTEQHFYRSNDPDDLRELNARLSSACGMILIAVDNKDSDFGYKHSDGIHVTSLLRRNVRSMAKRDIALSESIHPNIYYDRKYSKEVNRVGFSFLREGIYIHKGAGRGQGGYRGSRWTDKYGTLKATDTKSLGKLGTGNRRSVEWFNPIIERELEALADIVSDYSTDIQIDATRIFIS